MDFNSERYLSSRKVWAVTVLAVLGSNLTIAVWDMFLRLPILNIPISIFTLLPMLISVKYLVDTANFDSLAHGALSIGLTFSAAGLLLSIGAAVFAAITSPSTMPSVLTSLTSIPRLFLMSTGIYYLLEKFEEDAAMLSLGAAASGMVLGSSILFFLPPYQGTLQELIASSGIVDAFTTSFLALYSITQLSEHSRHSKRLNGMTVLVSLGVMMAGLTYLSNYLLKMTDPRLNEIVKRIHPALNIIQPMIIILTGITFTAYLYLAELYREQWKLND